MDQPIDRQGSASDSVGGHYPGLDSALVRAVVESAPTAMVMIDPAGIIVLVNAEAEKLFGYARNELLGQVVEALIPVRYRSGHPALRGRFFATPQARRMGVGRDLFAVRKDGSEFRVEIGLNPVVTGAGIFVLSAIVDITERKRLEDALRDMNQVLEQRVEERTAELARANAALQVEINERIRAEQAIQRLNAELETKVRERTQELMLAQEALVRREKLALLGQVAGSVGHELRNPLGVMSNAVYFLKNVLTDAPPVVVEYLDIVEDEINGAERIISELLDSVRTRPPQLQRVSVAQLVRQMRRRRIVPESVQVNVEIADDLPLIEVDPLHIQQVFRNLVDNAIDAVAGNGCITLRAHADAAAATVRVSIEDSGSGIAPEHIDKLFQPLFTTKARGIGLGLVVVKNLVEANGGRVEVQSAPGSGTTFTVILPEAGAAPSME